LNRITGCLSGILILSEDDMDNIGMKYGVGFLGLIQVKWNPQPDITAYELAQLLPLFNPMRPIMSCDIPTEPELLRHLIIDDPNIKK
jgi:hypothetical protein